MVNILKFENKLVSLPQKIINNEMARQTRMTNRIFCRFLRTKNDQENRPRDSTCNLWHDDFDVYTATISAVSPDVVVAGITAENGYSVPFNITYTITIDGNNISFHYYNTETFLGATGIVTSWIE